MTMRSRPDRRGPFTVAMPWKPSSVHSATSRPDVRPPRRPIWHQFGAAAEGVGRTAERPQDSPSRFKNPDFEWKCGALPDASAVSPGPDEPGGHIDVEMSDLARPELGQGDRGHGGVVGAER